MSCSNIGVFWVYKSQIYVKSIHIDKVKPIQGFIDSDFAHYQVWSEISLQNRDFYLYEYEDIPRGRVVYNIEDNQFIIYCNKNILEDTVSKNLILERFNLLNEDTIFKEDEHYRI